MKTQPLEALKRADLQAHSRALAAHHRAQAKANSSSLPHTRPNPHSRKQDTMDSSSIPSMRDIKMQTLAAVKLADLLAHETAALDSVGCAAGCSCTYSDGTCANCSTGADGGTSLLPEGQKHQLDPKSRVCQHYRLRVSCRHCKELHQHVNWKGWSGQQWVGKASGGAPDSGTGPYSFEQSSAPTLVLAGATSGPRRMRAAEVRGAASDKLTSGEDTRSDKPEGICIHWRQKSRCHICKENCLRIVRMGWSAGNTSKQNTSERGGSETLLRAKTASGQASENRLCVHRLVESSCRVCEEKRYCENNKVSCKDTIALREAYAANSDQVVASAIDRTGV